MNTGSNQYDVWCIGKRTDGRTFITIVSSYELAPNAIVQADRFYSDREEPGEKDFFVTYNGNIIFSAMKGGP